MLPNRSTPFFDELRDRIRDLGGLCNAHLHLDRAGTYAATLELMRSSGPEGSSHLSLAKKHSLIPMIHASHCYDPDELEARVDSFVQLLIDAGTTRADSVVDVTTDRVGRSALDRLLRIKHRRANEIDFRIGAYSPLGFTGEEPQRWALLADAARDADFVGALPERDDKAMYPDHIGFEENCRRTLMLSAELNKQLHIHVDQQNLEFESGSECVASITRDLGLGVPRDQEPRTWLIHAISPSAYGESRFEALVNQLVDLNIGIVCCPSAAISMRQIRPVVSPTHNSIARVLEMMAAGVHVRLGSDNVCDITSPAGTTDLVDEIFALSNIVRYYDMDVLARLGAGLPPNAEDRAKLQAHLVRDREEVARIAESYSGR